MTNKCLLVFLFLLQSYLLVNSAKRAFTLAPPTNPPANGCGVPAVQPITRRIVGGTPARTGSWPWLVLIVDDLGFVSATGVILNPNVILTTANVFEAPEHSFDIDFKYWKIYAGKSNIASADPHEKVYRIDKVIIHPNFNLTSLFSDIALVITSQPISYNDHTGPACLSEPGHMYTVGELCYMAGWGKNSGTGSNDVLNQLEIQILDDSECSKEYPSFNVNRIMQVCVGSNNQSKSWCDDDAGSPLMCKDRHGIWYIQGLASYAGECKLSSKPSVFQDVLMYSTWIKRTMAQAHLPYIY